MKRCRARCVNRDYCRRGCPTLHRLATLTDVAAVAFVVALVLLAAAVAR